MVKLVTLKQVSQVGIIHQMFSSKIQAGKEFYKNYEGVIFKCMQKKT